ncbi:MAG: hypothetical protein U5K32_12880 [Bacteroidales bacterium]|nr:hypothetical protein [Bacteroidales bacterium]
MTNITYLFGAGASANAIPVNKYLRDDIKEYAKFLNNDDFKKALRTKTSTYDNNKTKEDLLKSLIKDLTWLYEESEDFVSIDTLAKKFFLTKEIDNLRKLKVCLSIYLTIRQCKGKTDKRYDNFYASILKSNYSAFPRNIKVLSWNYDI